MSNIRIGIVEDQKLFRDGLASIVQNEKEFELVLMADRAETLFEQLKKSAHLPNIILLDMSLPDVNGIEINTSLHKEFPEIKTIILTAYDQARYIVRLIENGANSFLSKNTDVDELVLAIKTVFRSGFYFNQAILDALRYESGKKKPTLSNINGIPVELTNREMEILLLICKEFTTEEIAQQLFVSTRTVDGHRINLLDKTGCKNIAGLVIFAISNNLFLPIK